MAYKPLMVNKEGICFPHAFGILDWGANRRFADDQCRGMRSEDVAQISKKYWTMLIEFSSCEPRIWRSS